MDGDRNNELLLEHLGLVGIIARKVMARLPASVELDDLISAGTLGLMDAITKYEPERQNKFKTYAEFRIRGSILDHLRAMDWIPRSVRDKNKALEEATIELTSRLARQPTDDEIAAELELSIDGLRTLMDLVKPVSSVSMSYQDEFNNGDRKAILRLIGSMDDTDALKRLHLKRRRAFVMKLLEELGPRLQLVMHLYYLESMTLKQIGGILKVTECRVSQLHSQALVRLKKKLDHRQVDKQDLLDSAA